MIDLRQRREPYEIALPYGLSVTVKSLTTAGMAAAQAAARRAVDAVERDDDLPCARGERGADGRLCPYREHALISRQEHEAWDVLLACQGQLRLVPSGHVIGVEINAALRIGAARGHDLAGLSELLPAAEAGLVEALRPGG